MTDLLYRWPAAGAFGKRVPKEKLYSHGATGGARELLVAQVQRITWAYKLAEATINLPASAAVPEIQVLVIDAKTDDVSDRALTVIDKAVPFPIIFEVARGAGDSTQVRMTASHKQLGSGAPKLSSYFSTAWLDADAERVPLPTAIGLDGLYAALLEPLSPIAARPGESLSEVAARLDSVRKLEREVAVLERKLRAAAQLNRKIELRRELKERQAALAALV